jgi:hypothetical protein
VPFHVVRLFTDCENLFLIRGWYYVKDDSVPGGRVGHPPMRRLCGKPLTGLIMPEIKLKGIAAVSLL